VGSRAAWIAPDRPEQMDDRLPLVTPELLTTAQEEEIRMFAEELVDLDETLLKTLAETICTRNPYGAMQLAANWQSDIEEDSYEIGS
jgi:hypothetical protein